MDYPSQTTMARPITIQTSHHCNLNNDKQSFEPNPSLRNELPLHENFSASSQVPNRGSVKIINDTTTTADTTASFDKEKSGEFADFLASKEFDASAIVTGDEYEKCCAQEQELNVSIFSEAVLGDEFRVDAPAAAEVTPDQKKPPVYSNPVQDLDEPLNDVRKNQVSAPDIIDSSEHRNEGKEEPPQYWWPSLPSSIQAIWEQITAVDHCNCLAGTMWNTHESSEDNAKQDNPSQDRVVPVHEKMATTTNVISPTSSIDDKSTSFVLPSRITETVTTTPRTPLQRKLASTPVNLHVDANPTTEKSNYYASPMRIDYLEGRGTLSSSKQSQRPYVTSNPSELSRRSVVTPLIGEHLVSTPLHCGDDNNYYYYENSILSTNISKMSSSSHLFGQDISMKQHDKSSTSLVGENLFDCQKNECYSPPPAYLLPQAKIQREMLFGTSEDGCKTSAAAAPIFELSTAESQEEKGLGGNNRSDRYFKRVKDRRRMRRNDP